MFIEFKSLTKHDHFRSFKRLIFFSRLSIYQSCFVVNIICVLALNALLILSTFSFAGTLSQIYIHGPIININLLLILTASLIIPSIHGIGILNIYLRSNTETKCTSPRRIVHR